MVLYHDTQMHILHLYALKSHHVMVSMLRLEGGQWNHSQTGEGKAANHAPKQTNVSNAEGDNRTCTNSHSWRIFPRSKPEVKKRSFEVT
jgi:hypothetical protein